MVEHSSWRTGRRNNHTIYAQLNAEPSERDLFLGSLNTPQATQQAVDAVNAVARIRELHRPHDCNTDHMNPHTPTPCVHTGTCIGCGVGYSPCPTIRALEDQ